MVDSSIIFNILASIGGFSGLLSLTKWLKNRNSKVKILSSFTQYEVKDKNLVINGKLCVSNEKNKRRKCPVYT